jgi:hypothetical protein
LLGHSTANVGQFLIFPSCDSPLSLHELQQLHLPLVQSSHPSRQQFLGHEAITGANEGHHKLAAQFLELGAGQAVLFHGRRHTTDARSQLLDEPAQIAENLDDGPKFPHHPNQLLNPAEALSHAESCNYKAR